MKKDKEWLKNEILGLGIKARHKENNQREWHMGHEMALFDVNKLIDQLDEPKKQVIPQFVADYIEQSKKDNDSINQVFAFIDDKEDKELWHWLFPSMYEEKRTNQEVFMRAWLYGYDVEKEPVYFAKIKGHELVETETVLDEDTGDDITEFYRNVYFVLQKNGELVIDMKDNGLSGAKNVMTMNEWNNLGINETNADFEELTASHR